MKVLCPEYNFFYKYLKNVFNWNMTTSITLNKIQTYLLFLKRQFFLLVLF